MRCQIFETRDDAKDLENQINRWLEANPGVIIKHIAQSGSQYVAGFRTRIMIYTTIFYEYNK